MLRASREHDIASVVGVLREHAALAGVQKHGLRELDDLIPDPGMGIQSAPMVAAMQAGALEVAVAALQTHSARADVQLHACIVVTRLSEGYPAEVGASGAIEAAVRGMREHAGCASAGVRAV